ncbi:MAG: tryptophan synthase subunit alpha, partial [Ghiorsea sp.]
MPKNNHLAQVFTRCKAKNRAALVGFLTAGDPDPETSRGNILALAAEVDILEIGMPFSDPMADGPVIEAASVRALAAGTRIKDVFSLAADVRQAHPDIGIVLMGYANVAYALGFEAFAQQAQAAGVDGVLLVDIPAEENDICASTFAEHGLHQIMLLSPTSSEDRIRLAAE